MWLLVEGKVLWSNSYIHVYFSGCQCFAKKKVN